MLSVQFPLRLILASVSWLGISKSQVQTRRRDTRAQAKASVIVNSY